MGKKAPKLLCNKEAVLKAYNTLIECLIEIYLAYKRAQ